MRLNRQQRLRLHQQLLSPWEKREQEWMSFKDIMVKATEIGLNRRTVIRNLKNIEKFEPDPRGYNKIFYRPTKGFSSWILHESLKTEDSFVDDQIAVWLKAKEEIDKQFDNLQEWYFKKDSRIRKERETTGGGTGLSPDGYKKLDCLIDQLLQTLKSSVSVDFLAGGEELEDIYHLLVNNLTELISAYTELWVFNSMTYAAPKNCSDQLKVIPEALKRFRKKRDSPKRRKNQ
jgi:hypothetical protein